MLFFQVLHRRAYQFLGEDPCEANTVWLFLVLVTSFSDFAGTPFLNREVLVNQCGCKLDASRARSLIPPQATTTRFTETTKATLLMHRLCCKNVEVN